MPGAIAPDVGQAKEAGEKPERSRYNLIEALIELWYSRTRTTTPAASPGLQHEKPSTH